MKRTATIIFTFCMMCLANMAIAQKVSENPTQPGWRFQALWGKKFVVPGVFYDSASLPAIPTAYTYSTGADSTRGAMAYTVADSSYWTFTGTRWRRNLGITATGGGGLVADSVILNRQAKQPFKRFDIMSARLDSLLPSTANGLRLNSAGGDIAVFGSGGGTTSVFSGHTGYNSNIAATYTARAFTDKNYVDSSIAASGGSGIKHLKAIGTTPNANGASIVGDTLQLQPASESYGGVITTGAQNIIGEKTMHSVFYPTLNNHTNGEKIRFQSGPGAASGIGVRSLSDGAYMQFFQDANGGTTYGFRFRFGYFSTSVSGVGLGGDALRISTLGTFLNPSYPLSTTSGGPIQTANSIKIYPNNGFYNAQLILQDSAGLGKRTWIGSRLTGGALPYNNLTFSLAPIAISSPGREAFVFGKGVSAQFFGETEPRWLTIYKDSTIAYTNLQAPTLSIGLNGISSSALAEFSSTTKGLLMPRMTATQRNAISSPANGLAIFNTTTATNDVYTTAWYSQPNGLKASAVLDFSSTAAQSAADLTITITGAAIGDMVFLGTPVQDANSTYTAFVSAANTVTVRLNNYSSAAIDPASGTFNIYVIKN